MDGLTVSLNDKAPGAPCISRRTTIRFLIPGTDLGSFLVARGMLLYEPYQAPCVDWLTTASDGVWMSETPPVFRGHVVVWP